ncbi:MAG: membrane protein [Kiritimatiellia bacterium]|jgi:membrane protein
MNRHRRDRGEAGFRALYQQLVPDDGGLAALRPVIGVIRWSVVFYRQLEVDRAFIRSSAMAYTTLVTMVPLFLLVFGLLSATGVVHKDQQAIEQLIFDTVIADLPQVRNFIMRGVGDLDLTALGIIGVASLVIFAGRLFIMVEQAYNQIFGTRVRRKWAYRLLAFWFTLTIVPLVLSLGFASTIDLLGTYGMGPWARSVVDATVLFVMLLAALKLFPSVKVEWGPALLGSMVSTIGIGISRSGFGLYLLWFKADDPLTIVYGTVGLIPVFLLWLYLLWLMVLLGVEVAYVAQNFQGLWEVEATWLEGDRDAIRGPGLHTALELAAWVGWHYDNGDGAMPLVALASRSGLLQREIVPIMDLLTDNNHLVYVDDSWLPARPTSAILLAQLVTCWRQGASPHRKDQAEMSGAEGAVTQALVTQLPKTLAQAIDAWITVPLAASSETPTTVDT